MKVTKYGAAFIHFGGSDAALTIEVQRKQRQRPIFASASFATTGIMVPNSYNRLIVYRGNPFKERIAGTSPDPTQPTVNGPTTWDTLPLVAGNFDGVDVIYDQIFTGAEQPCSVSFKDWPDEECMAQEGQALGAIVLQPIDGSTGSFLANANAMLVFIGGDVAGAIDPVSGSIPDVRDLKAK